MNLYEYAGDDPVNQIDPSGLEKIYINNNSHYNGVLGYAWYDNRHYVIDVPDGQSLTQNMAAAMAEKPIIEKEGGWDPLKGAYLKKAWLAPLVRTGSIGDYGKEYKPHGKRPALYPRSDPAKNPALFQQRRYGANFNFGAMGAALGFDLKSLNLFAQYLDIGRHPQKEQDAIEDGWYYFYYTHPASAKADAVTIPTGIKFGVTMSSSPP